MGENWLLFSGVAAWLTVQLARITATYRTAKRRDKAKAGRQAP
jgi:hypothetical protein